MPIDIRGGGTLGDLMLDEERTYQPSPWGTMPVGDRIPMDPSQGAAPWQHPQSLFDAGSSIMAPRLFNQNGQWILTEHGNQRPLIGDEVGQAQGYVSDFAAKFPTGFQPGIGPQTNEEYGVSPEQLQGFWPGGGQSLFRGPAMMGGPPMQRPFGGSPQGGTLGDLMLSGSSYADPREMV